MCHLLCFRILLVVCLSGVFFLFNCHLVCFWVPFFFVVVCLCLCLFSSAELGHLVPIWFQLVSILVSNWFPSGFHLVSVGFHLVSSWFPHVLQWFLMMSSWFPSGFLSFYNGFHLVSFWFPHSLQRFLLVSFGFHAACCHLHQRETCSVEARLQQPHDRRWQGDMAQRQRV